eukprot:scaffold23197_cov36-Tisochrysis_lutea.AAC.1
MALEGASLDVWPGSGQSEAPFLSGTRGTSAAEVSCTLSCRDRRGDGRGEGGEEEGEGEGKEGEGEGEREKGKEGGEQRRRERARGVNLNSPSFDSCESFCVCVTPLSQHPPIAVGGPRPVG